MSSGDVAARVLACVESIPPGRVMTYGDVAEYVGIRSARQVGRVLALDDGTVPWHRVLRADGSLAEHLYSEQRQRLLERRRPLPRRPGRSSRISVGRYEFLIFVRRFRGNVLFVTQFPPRFRCHADLIAACPTSGGCAGS